MTTIAIIDFGSQTTQLIARRVREMNVFCRIFPHDASKEDVASTRPSGFILSGGPASIYAPGAPRISDYILESNLPILGICYGMQALAHQCGGEVSKSISGEYGSSEIDVLQTCSILPPEMDTVWMGHGDQVEKSPPGYQNLAKTSNCPIAAFAHPGMQRYGVQFHPEVQHTPQGAAVLRNFVLKICRGVPDWTPASIIENAVDHIRSSIGSGRAISAVSGGVDSSVATALVHRAIGDRLRCIHVDTGLMRAGETKAVLRAFNDVLGVGLSVVDASDRFFNALSGVTNPEEKRRIIGETFIRIFEEHASAISGASFLVQGTIYPDVVESNGPGRQDAARIKTHHNVGGLPEDMELRLVEPLRMLFKDEVRKIGHALGVPDELLWRQPFPGPGLAVRCLGEVTRARVERLRHADAIVTNELGQAGLLRSETAQAFAVLLPVRTVGVQGDARTYAETIAIRAVTTDDFMTADWARLPYDILGRISRRIGNEVKGVNRVVYDISSKPPSTIEWE